MTGTGGDSEGNSLAKALIKDVKDPRPDGAGPMNAGTSSSCRTGKMWRPRSGRFRPIADTPPVMQCRPVRDWFSGPLPWLLGAMIVAVLAIYIWLLGSVVVVDETEGVLSAAVVAGHGRERQLHHLGGGYFFVIPDLEGTVEVRCKSGVRKRWGYVTLNMHTKVRVQGREPCAQLVNG